MKFGERITELRKKNKLTQVEIARKLKISRSTYANYELDNREPNFEMTEKLAKIFDVTVDYLLGRPEKEKSSEAAADPVKELIFYLDELKLSTDEIVDRMDFQVDEMLLSREEAMEFVNYVRVKRAMKKAQNIPH